MGVMYEQLFKKNNSKKEKSLKNLSIILFVIILLVTLFLSLTNNMIFLLLCALEFYGFYWLIKQFYIEYEYSFVNGSLDVDVIYAMSKRKRIASLECSNVYEVGKFEDLRSLENVIMAANENEQQLYYFVFDGKQAKQTIVLQPDEKMLNNLKTYIPRSVTINKI